MTSPFGPLVLIVDPRGSRRTANDLRHLEGLIDSMGLERRTQVLPTTEDAAAVARAALDAGERFIVAAGTDATVSGVVNGMIDDDGPVDSNAVLGVLPWGWPHDFVLTFGLPEDPFKATRYLVGDNLYAIDAAKVTCAPAAGGGSMASSYFVNVAEVGLGAKAERIASRLPRSLGRGRYFAGFWSAVATTKPRPLTVHAGRRSYEGPGHAVIVANGQFYGGGRKISPRSWPSDGNLDVLVMKGPRSDSFTMLPKVYLGEHLPHPDIGEYRAERVEVRADRPLWVAADGVPVGRTPATFQAIPEAVRLKV